MPQKDLLLQQAYQAYEAGDQAAARASYADVLTIEAKNRDALLGMAAIHINNNEITEAMQNYQIILEQNPKDTLALTALISVANVEPEVSESQLKIMLRDQSDAAYLHFALGNVYGAQNKWREAQSTYFTALEYKPDDPNYAYNFAVSLEHIQQPKVAITYYERALANAASGLATFNQQIVIERLELLKQL